MAWSDLATEFFKFLNQFTLKPSKEIKKVVKIYDEMHKVLDETDVQRMLVIKAHNGGGLIRPSTQLYVSVLYEDYTVPFKSVKEEYQKLPVDSEYLRMMSILCEQKSVKLIPKEMRPGILKEIYTTEGVQYAEIYFLGQDRKNLYFVSLATAWEKGWDKNPGQSLIVKLAVNTLKNNIF